MSYKKSILLRVRILFILMCLFSSAIAYRLVVIQFVDGDKWRQMGKGMGVKVKDLSATRGNIYSDEGGLLATSVQYYKLAMDPSVSTKKHFDGNIDDLCFKISNFFKDKSPDAYKKIIESARASGREYLLVNRRKFDFQDKKEMGSWPLFNLGRLRGGVLFEATEKRILPYSQLGYRTVGTVNADNKGIVGLEYSFNRQLAGRDGKALYRKISVDGWTPVYDGTEIKPINGYDIKTTINVDLQYIAENALLKALLKHQADYGALILMEVQTGEIKAISNLSRNGSGRYWERYNYAVGSQGSREPGSTFKLASMIGLLEEGDIGILDTVDTGNGVKDFFDQTMKDPKPGGHGKLTVQEVFEKSSNIGIAKLVTAGFENKPQKFIDYLNNMGLTQPIGFQMIGEGKPYIKSPSQSSWSGTTLPWMAHGYELRMTPLQMLTLYNAVANDGKMIQPMIVRSVMKMGKEVESFEPKVMNKRICSDKTLEKIKIMLKGVVERGTARNIYDVDYPIAGKTGTAKKLKNGEYTDEYYASFAGYFPAVNPKYSCIVVIDNPKGFQIYGSDVAAPVFMDLVKQIARIEVEFHHNIPSVKEKKKGTYPVIRSGYHTELAEICNELGVKNHALHQSGWVTTKVDNGIVNWVPNKMNAPNIPDVLGMTLRDAIYLLENTGLKVKTVGRGRVVSQSLAPGSKKIYHKEIKLRLG